MPQVNPNRPQKLERVLMAKSMLAYSEKMRQLSNNKAAIPFMGVHMFQENKTHKRGSPVRPRHLFHQQHTYQWLDEETSRTDHQSTDGLLRGHQAARSNRRHIDQPLIRSISDPLTSKGSYNVPCHGLRRFGAGNNLARLNKLKGETNVLSLTTSSSRRASNDSVYSDCGPGSAMGVTGQAAQIHRSCEEATECHTSNANPVHAVKQSHMHAGDDDDVSFRADTDFSSVDLTDVDQHHSEVGVFNIHNPIDKLDIRGIADAKPTPDINQDVMNNLIEPGTRGRDHGTETQHATKYVPNALSCSSNHNNRQQDTNEETMYSQENQDTLTEVQHHVSSEYHTVSSGIVTVDCSEAEPSEIDAKSIRCHDDYQKYNAAILPHTPPDQQTEKLPTTVSSPNQHTHINTTLNKDEVFIGTFEQTEKAKQRVVGKTKAGIVEDIKQTDSDLDQVSTSIISSKSLNIGGSVLSNVGIRSTKNIKPHIIPFGTLAKGENVIVSNNTKDAPADFGWSMEKKKNTGKHPTISKMTMTEGNPNMLKEQKRLVTKPTPDSNTLISADSINAPTVVNIV